MATLISSQIAATGEGRGRVTTRGDPPWARLISSQIAAATFEGRDV